MYGATNEYLIFPIIELIQKELRKALESGALDALVNQANNRGGSITNTSTTTNITYEGNILDILESNDYEIELQKNDPDNPNILTAAIITYGRTLKLVINLIRESGKLTTVKMTVVKTEPISEVQMNPYNMSGSDFITYVRNKRKWRHYANIAADLGNPQEVIDHAQQQMLAIDLENTQLRNIYGIPMESDLPYENLVKYLRNPLAMDDYDFISYMWNARAWLGEYPGIPQEIKDKAHEENVLLREKYFISQEEYEMYTYAELKEYLPYPPGFHSDDFVTYVANKKEYAENLKQLETETDPVVRAILEDRNAAILAHNQSLYDKYYTNPSYTLSGWDDSLENLIEHLPKDDSILDEKVLLKIIISLIYNNEGMLSGVKSVTEQGES